MGPNRGRSARSDGQKGNPPVLGTSSRKGTYGSRGLPGSRSFEASQELVEEIATVVGARRGLRVVLDARDREGPVPNALAGTVVEIHMGEFQVLGARDPPSLADFDRETVVLRSDLDGVPIEIPDRMIGPVMPERQLEGPGSEGSTDELVS